MVAALSCSPRLAFEAWKAMSEVQTQVAPFPQPANLVGTWRRFGIAGPVYEIIAAGHALPDGDHVMRVRVIETGEEVDYKFSEVLDDPRER
jgi:hypothetical protein